MVVEHEKGSANIHIVNPGDGQKLLLDVTKHIAQLIKQRQVTQGDITPDYIDKLLQGKLMMLLLIIILWYLVTPCFS